MKIRARVEAIITICWLVGISVLRAENDVKLQDVSLGVSVPRKVPLGQDLTIDLTLESKFEQSLYSLETADLEVIIEKVDSLSEEKYVCNRGRLREIRATAPDGQEMLTLTVKVDKQLIVVGGEKKSVLSLSFTRDFNTRLSCGTYKVSAMYEGSVSSDSYIFSIVLDYERTVPELIDLIENGNEWDVSWSRGKLFSIIGRPSWIPSRQDTKERVNLEVSELRKWWVENKELVLIIESQAKSKGVVYGNKSQDQVTLE